MIKHLKTTFPWLVFLSLLAGSAHAAELVTDHFESGTASWQTSGLWGLTTSKAASPTHSLTDSPGAFYANSTDTSLTLAAAIDLTATSRPVLSFYHGYELENGYDLGKVEISIDNGATWQGAPLAQFTGSQSIMAREQVDLAAFGTQTQVKVRFRLVTDASVVMDGWYVDDVVIGSAPIASTLATPAPGDIGQASVTLNWTASSDPAFASYVILRGTQAGFDWRTAKVVATITNPAVVTATDIAAAPKSNYHYAVMTLNAAGLHALSNSISVTTAAGMDFPFLDDGEAGGNFWVSTSPWAISDEDFHSPGHAWSDSPGGNYANGIASQALTLAAPLNLSTATNPVLSFHHRYTLAAGDTANVEASTNLGSSWTSLATYPAGTIAWQQGRISLSSFIGQPAVLVRFRITTNASANADGWHVDDISVAEAPAVMAAPAIDQITSHEMRLSWNVSTALPFSHYAIHRSTTSNVGINSPRVAMISNQATTSFTDTGLALDTLYYYRIYAVSPYGTYSADSTAEASARTLNNPLPFTADFDSTLLAWNFGTDAGVNTWGQSTEIKRSGTGGLASSPGSSYPPSVNTWTETSLDLRNTEWPVLTFWDRFGLNTGDYLRLEITATGGPSVNPYGAYESTRSVWARQRIDLSPWKGLSNVKLRFRVVSDAGATPGEGWFIDDLNVSENSNRNTPLAMPFTDGFETTANDWLLSSWTAQPDGTAIDGGSILREGNASRRMVPDGSHTAALDRPIVLPAGSNTQITYWVRGSLGVYSYFRLQYSINGGVTWTELAAVNRNYGYNSNGAWERCQASLASLAGQTVRLRLVTSCDYRAPVVDISVDKFTVAEMPAAVALVTAIPSLRSIDLTWTPTTLGAAFARYELWRSESANISFTNGTKIFESTNSSTVTYNDANLNIGGTYYYKVYSVDSRDTFIPSNELSSTTVPVTIPFTDSMDAMDNWVSGSNNATPSAWSVNSVNPHGGAASISSVPVGQYPPSSDSYIETAIDLRNTEWPVLTFWDRFGLNTGDYVRLEITATGGPSVNPYGAFESSRSVWGRQRIDLSPWKGLSNVKLRFRVVSDGGATPGEGWFIDDLNVSENTNRNTPIVLPFTDGFETSASDWLLSSWTAQPDGTAIDGGSILREGNATRRMVPDGSHTAALDRPIVLPAGSNTQITYWVRGSLGVYSYFRLQYSINGGGTWTELASVNRNYGYNSNGSWERCQASLASLAGQTVRLRFTTSCDYRAPVVDISVDKFTIAEMPAAVSLVTAVPSLRSVDLTWTPTTLGASFARYEVWRSEAANISFTNGTKIFESTNPATVTYNDANLNIGGTYYYKVYSVDSRDTFIPSNELSSTTVPVTIPFTDPMDAMSNWVTGSNNATPSAWSVNSVNPHGGVASISSVPVGQYLPSTDSYIETAVDLRNTEWPVLTFWDRFGLNTGDYVRLEITATGGPSVNPYGAFESSRSAWGRQRIDLSPWKGLSNVKLRFHIVSDGGATPGDGWFIDDLTVSENSNRNTPLAMPFTDGFETTANDWLMSSWTAPTDAAAIDGASVLREGSSTRRMVPDGNHTAALDRPMVLPAGSNVQVTYWVRGSLGVYSYFRLHYSTNGGVTWTELASVNRNYGFNSNGSWERCQASLASLAGQTVRLRLVTSCDYRAPVVDISVDKFTVAEMPAAVATLPIDDVNITSLRLNWTPSNLATFLRYEIYRSTSANVSNASTLAGTITNSSAGNFTDTALEARMQYFYRVYVIDQRDTASPSEIVSATTLGMTIPLAESFETSSPGWTFTGQWQRQPGVGRDGGIALVDSPGDYLASTDTTAQFAVNLNGMQWPVLRYWDKHHFAGGSWGRLEVSTDNASWTIVNGVTEIRTAWQMQEVDLSQWKNQTRVFIRFRSGTDGSLSDGWTIDDLSLNDRGIASVYPFVDGFEAGMGSWIPGSWAPVSDQPQAGNASVQDTPNRRNGPDTPNYLVLSKELDLTSSITPTLTFFLRGNLGTYSWFRVQVSTTGGLSWTDISTLNRDTGFNSLTWIKQQVSLATWKGQKIRLRFASGSDYRQPACDIFLDNIGIGEPTPGAPVLLAPFENQTVPIVRPTLTVTNAVDFQSDALTHQFEVYADAALTQLVSQIPTVASGNATTSWQVDIDLQDHAPYWWRARASDGINVGPWTNAVVFNINEFNNAPLPITIASPADDSVMLDGNGLLVWFQTSDPDLGDEVRDYQIQIDDDETFASPNIDHSGITVDPETYGPGYLAAVLLNDLPGSAALPSGRWFWRIRARDTRFASGAWSPGYHYFRLPTFYQRYLRSIYPDPDWFLYDVTNPQADPDGNGVGVLMDFACAITPGAEPGDRLPKPIEVQISGRTHQGFEWTRRKLSELDFLLETSSSLQGWQTDVRAAVEVLHSVDELSERVRIIDPDPTGTHRRHFIRLKIED